MTDVERRLVLLPGWRYRCFAWSGELSGPCRGTASKFTMDSARGDAKTFWCELHAPKGAAAIARNDAYLALDVAAVLTFGASTVRSADARSRGIALLDEILRAEHVKLTVVGVNSGLMAPHIPIIGGTARPDA